MPDLFQVFMILVIGLAAWGALDLGGITGRAARALARRRPMPAAEMDALIPATSEARPHPELAGPAPRVLCGTERLYADTLRAWLASEPERHAIEANGRNLADYLRQAMPDAGDLDLGRAVRALLRATPAYRHLEDPYVMFSDALAAAFLDLTSLERSTTP